MSPPTPNARFGSHAASQGGKYPPVPIAKDEPLKLELQHFVECVRAQQTPRVSGESARRALELAFEITKQIQEA